MIVENIVNKESENNDTISIKKCVSYKNILKPEQVKKTSNSRRDEKPPANGITSINRGDEKPPAKINESNSSVVGLENELNHVVSEPPLAIEKNETSLTSIPSPADVHGNNTSSFPGMKTDDEKDINEQEVNFDNIINLSEGDYTTQSYYSISAPDSFMSLDDPNEPPLENDEIMISQNLPHTPPYPSLKTPPYPILKNKKDNLVPTLRDANKINFQMNIPLPKSPPISPFLLKQKENINPLEEENKKSPLQKKTRILVKSRIQPF